MRVLSLSSLILFFALAVPLAAQDEIFIDTFEAGSTTSWHLDVSRCTQFFAGGSFTDHCYKWIPGTGDWFDSQAECSRWAPGGRLISAESAEEWHHVTLHRVPPNSKSWIGLSRGVRDSCPGAWAWESGEPISFTNWDPGEPNAGGCPACATSWKDLGDRWDDLACDASGLVSDSICEVDLSVVRIVGRNGGRLTFPNGAVLDVPAGAVDDDTAIAVRSLECAELDPLLNSRPMNSHDKRCLAAVDMAPSTLNFPEPVTLTLPVMGLQPGEIPVLADVFPKESDYAYRATDLDHYPATDTIEVELASPGVLAITALAAPSRQPSSSGPGKAPSALCEQGNIAVQSEFVDLSVKDGDVECSLIFDSVSVTFLDCDGSPTQAHEMAEAVGCSDKTYFEGRVCGPGVLGEACFVDPQPVTTVITGDTVRLHAWARAIDPDQNNRELFIANIDHATYQWQSLNTALGRFPDSGEGVLEAAECLQQVCPFDVQALNRYVSSPLPKGKVNVLSSAEGIFDVEWYYSWNGDEQCTLNGEGYSSFVRERFAGGWGGSATFLIPDYLDSEVLAYEPSGAIQFRQDVDGTGFCDEPTRVVHWDGIIQQTWYPEMPCTQYESRLELQEDEERMNFWSCIPLQQHYFDYASGMSCTGPLNISDLYLVDGIPCFFPDWVELTHQGEGVFEIDETLFLEPACTQFTGLGCTVAVPVSVYVRAVPRWDVTTSQSKEGSPQSP
jgi:hypothetical protein